MKQITSLKNMMTVMGSGVVCMALLSAVSACGHEKKASPDTAAGEFKTVTLSKFAFHVPSAWSAFSPGDTAQLRSQFIEQSKQIYQQYSGSSEDPAKSVDVAAFHIEPDDGALIAVALTIPPQVISSTRFDARQNRKRSGASSKDSSASIWDSSRLMRETCPASTSKTSAEAATWRLPAAWSIKS